MGYQLGAPEANHYELLLTRQDQLSEINSFLGVNQPKVGVMGLRFPEVAFN